MVTFFFVYIGILLRGGFMKVISVMASQRSDRDAKKRLSNQEINDLLNDSDENFEFSSDSSDNYDEEGGSGTESSDEEGSDDGRCFSEQEHVFFFFFFTIILQDDRSF